VMCHLKRKGATFRQIKTARGCRLVSVTLAPNLECGSRLTLFETGKTESARGLAHSKLLPGVRNSLVPQCLDGMECGSTRSRVKDKNDANGGGNPKKKNQRPKVNDSLHLGQI